MTLQLFRTQKQLDGTAKEIAVLQTGGVPFEILDREGCIAAEPDLAPAREKIIGGLHLPGDETGDCFKFTSALAAIAPERGALFRDGEAILGQIEALLAEADSEKTKILSATIWLADLADFAEMNAVWDKWVDGKDATARATSEAKFATPDYKVELIVIAAR